MNDKILVLEMQLLLVRHGRKKVLEALATTTEQSHEEIESEIKAVEEKKKTSRTRRVKTPEELISNACTDRPDISSELTKLVQMYENKALLPQLRQIERFLDHSSIKHGKLKSRRAALPKVIDAFATMTKSQLNSFVEENTNTGESGFSLLANEIMGKTGDK